MDSFQQLIVKIGIEIIKNLALLTLGILTVEILFSSLLKKK